MYGKSPSSKWEALSESFEGGMYTLPLLLLTNIKSKLSENSLYTPV
jgi:hypothetical protein